MQWLCYYKLVVPIFCNGYLVCVEQKKQTVRLRIHHKGQLVYHPVKWYVGETEFKTNWDWEMNLMSYMQIESMIKVKVIVI